MTEACTMTPLSKPGPRRRRRLLPLRRGYSLAAAVPADGHDCRAGGDGQLRAGLGNDPWDVTMLNLGIGFLGGGLIGGTIGIQYQKRVRSTVIGIMAGSMAGLVAAAITVADLSPSAAFVDCGLLIGLAVFVRLMTTSRLKPSPVVYEDRPARKLPWSHVHPGRLAAAIAMGLCTVVALEPP